MNAWPGTEAHPFGTAHPLPVRGRHTHCPFGTATPRYTLRRAPPRLRRNRPLPSMRSWWAQFPT